MKLLNRHMYNLVTNEYFLMLLWKASKRVLLYYFYPCSAYVFLVIRALLRLREDLSFTQCSDPLPAALAGAHFLGKKVQSSSALPSRPLPLSPVAPSLPSSLVSASGRRFAHDLFTVTAANLLIAVGRSGEE